MNTTLLITPIELKTIVPFVNNEIDNTLISNTIILVQNTLVRDSLTIDMYEDVTTNSGTSNNKYLIDNYLKFLISYGVWQQLSVFLSLNLNSAGLRIKVSDHSQAAESVDITFYRNYIQNFIDNVRKNMEEYIEHNQSKYPLYYVYENGKMPNTSNFRIGRVGGGDDYSPKTDGEYPYWRTT